jgi:hypothetical protein
MMKSIPRFLALAIVGSVLLGCGGAVEPSQAPARPAAQKTAPPAASGDSRPRPAPAPASSSASASAEPAPAQAAPVKLSSKPHDIITGENTSHSFNFASSDAHGAADQKCRAKVGDDPADLASCMAKARDKFGITVLRFVKKNKVWWWVTYERRGQQLVTLHKIPFEFGAETDSSVTLRPTGKDVGLAPLARVPREVVIRLPSESTIELDDPTHGKMVYDAKIGMVQ